MALHVMREEHMA